MLHKYVYGLVPPAAVTVAEPVLFPKHNMLFCEVIVAVSSNDGSDIVTLLIIIQLLPGLDSTMARKILALRLFRHLPKTFSDRSRS